MPKSRSSRIYLLIAVLIAAFCLYLSLRNIDWNEFVDTLRRTRLEYLALAFMVFSVSLFMRGIRWRILLSAEMPISIMTAFWGSMVGYLGNNVLPARAGEVIRSAMIGRKANISTSYVLATALTERILDVPALVLASLLALMSMSLPNIPDWVISGTRAMAVLGVIGTIGIFVAPYMEKWIKAVIEPILRRLPIPGHIGDKLVNLLEEFLYGMRALHNPGRALFFILLTSIIWVTEGYLAILTAQALGKSLTLAEVMLLLAALGFSSAVPSTPGYVGIYQAVCIGILTNALGLFTQSEALAFSILFQVLTFVVVIFWGVPGMWRLAAGSKATADTPAQTDSEIKPAVQSEPVSDGR